MPRSIPAAASSRQPGVRAGRFFRDLALSLIDPCGAIMTSQRDFFYPNTETLAADEMRVTALGTGRPFVRRGQANCSWLIELGNGDQFVMDFGSGSQANFTALEIPHQDVTAYFAT